MKPSHSRRIRIAAHAGAVAVALGWIFAAGWSQAQETIVESNRFFDVVKVNVVNVETFVTDTKGQPVLGLGPEDFEILVDGEAVPIRNFFTVEGNKVRYQEVAQRRGAAPSADAAPPLPDYQRLNLIVYVDNSAIPPRARNRVLGQLKALLSDNMGPDDRIMVVSHGSSLDIRHSFSDPVSDIGPLLDAMAKEVGLGGLFDNDRDFILRTMDRTSTLEPQIGTGQDTRLEEARALLEQIRGWCQYKYDATRMSIQTLRQLIDSLAGLPGRKAVMYVGEGTSMRIGEPLYEAWVRKFSSMWSTIPNAPSWMRGLSPQTESNRFSVQSLFRDLANRANSNRVTFYAVDASQSAVGSYISAANPGFEGGVQIAAMQAFGQQASLQYLASTTGGRHLTNLENVALMLEQLQDDFQSYYSLGFSPREESDGSYHRIDVKVKREGCRVRHREGFRSKPADEFMSDRTLSAVFLGVTTNPLNIALATGDAHLTEDKNAYLLPVNITIPLGRLLLLPMEDAHEGRLTVFVTVRGIDGRASDVQRRELPLRVPNEVLLESAERNLSYTIDLMMRPGEQTVAVGVRDELAEIDSTVSVDVEVGATKAATTG